MATATKRSKATPEQTAKAEARRKAFYELARKVGDMQDEERLALSEQIPNVTTIEGRVLSTHNQCLLAHQRPDVTMVGGFRQWIEAGRIVRKGEKGLSIWIPAKQKYDANRQPGEMSSADGGTRFFMGTVFDVSQTEILEAKKEA